VAAVGVATRGTTAPNRLRRVDRWLVDSCGRALRSAADPLVVDLGFGASPVTTLELAARLATVRGDVDVVGLEIDRDRVAAARPYASTAPRVTFEHGGFELPVGDRRPVVVRAMNVLRQYDEGDVSAVWRLMTRRLAGGGTLIDGTCDEPGRLATWVSVGCDGRPRSLTLAAATAHLDRPSALAARLPKVLIHRNVPGEPVHALLVAFDEAWAMAAPVAPFGRRQRWAAAVATLRSTGWPVLSTSHQVRRGELTVAWAAVAPTARPECRP